MKAAHNGAINMSTYDGWFIEGIEQNPNAGWTIGPKKEQVKENADWREDIKEDASGLYSVLKESIDLFKHKKDFTNMMKESVTLASYFNTHRMVDEYKEKSWKI